MRVGGLGRPWYEVCPVDVPRNFSLDYGYNEICAGSWWMWTRSNMNTWKYSHNIVIFSDAKGFINEGSTIVIAYPNVCAAQCHPERRKEKNTRHLGSENLLFADGHVRAFSTSDILNKRGFTMTPMPWIKGQRRWP